MKMWIFTIILVVAACSVSDNTQTSLTVPTLSRTTSLGAPGAINPAVTQATIRTTICVSGWTKTVRPPANYTNQLKVDQIKLYNLPGKPSQYEEDHMIPLELGGAPTNPNNLWPQLRTGLHSAGGKDKKENLLHKEVCNGTITLQAARTLIMDPTSW